VEMKCKINFPLFFLFVIELWKAPDCELQARPPLLLPPGGSVWKPSPQAEYGFP
jgi:hypothetical protein